MIYILFILLLILLFSSLILTRGDILSPWVISIGMILVSCLFAVLYAHKWELHMGSYSTIIIIFSLLLFGLGELFVEVLNELYYKKSPPFNHSCEANTLSPVIIPEKVTRYIIVLLMLFLCYYATRIYKISLIGGNNEGIKGMLQYARDVLTTPGNHVGRLGNHMMLFAEAAATIYLLAFINNIVLKRHISTMILNLCPVIIYFFFGVINTGRIFIIKLFATSLIYFLVLDSKKQKWKKPSIAKVLLLGITAIVIYFILFTILGILKGSSVNGIFDKIAFYTGLSIPSFDYFVQTHDGNSLILGEETLYGVHNILRRIGIFIPEKARHLELLYFSGVKGNVYMSFRRYMNDYGLFGLFLIQFSLGVLYKSLYTFLKHTKYFYPVLILYGFLFYPLIMQGIDEMLFSSLISTSTVYLTVYICILYYVCIHKWSKKYTH